MRSWNRQWIAWTLLGTLLGTAFGLMLARVVIRHAAVTRLDAYTDHLISVANEIALEINSTEQAVLANGAPPCSDADLAFMRSRVYNAKFIRDLGRGTDSQLLCTTSAGRLRVPREVGPADVVARGARVRVSTALVLSPGTHGFVVQRSGVAMVINARQFDSLDQPPMLFGSWLYVPEQGVLLHSFGHDLPLPAAVVPSGKSFVQAGWLYRSQCTYHAMACVVAGVSLHDIAGRGRWANKLLPFLGALLGTCIALIALLYVRRHRSLEAQLRRALRRHELRLEYQPIVDLRSEALVGVEALARWVPLSGERIPPERFIGVAEERGFIRDVTRYILRRGLADLADLLQRDGLRLSINISSQDLTDSTFPEFLAAELAAAGLDASVLALEITEHSTANHAAALDSIERLRRAGHVVAIDDFGTGFSSLAYLHDLDVDAIKIDRRFTQTIGTQAVTASVVPQILSMAAQLRLQVIVEGIETAEQAEYFSMAAPGAQGQGYLFGRSMTPSALRSWIAATAASRGGNRAGRRRGRAQE